MISFKTFLAEIAVDPAMSLPVVPKPLGRSSSKIVHGESDPSHAVVPLVVHPKHLEMFGDMDLEGTPWARGQAAGVLERLMGQPRDGGLLAVNISNSEAASLKSMMDGIVSDSEKVMGSGAAHDVKDEAMRWIVAANAMLKSLRNGLGTANV